MSTRARSGSPCRRPPAGPCRRGRPSACRRRRPGTSPHSSPRRSSTRGGCGPSGPAVRRRRRGTGRRSSSSTAVSSPTVNRGDVPSAPPPTIRPLEPVSEAPNPSTTVTPRQQFAEPRLEAGRERGAAGRDHPQRLEPGGRIGARAQLLDHRQGHAVADQHEQADLVLDGERGHGGRVEASAGPQHDAAPGEQRDEAVPLSVAVHQRRRHEPGFGGAARRARPARRACRSAVRPGCRRRARRRTGPPRATRHPSGRPSSRRCRGCTDRRRSVRRTTDRTPRRRAPARSRPWSRQPRQSSDAVVRVRRRRARSRGADEAAGRGRGRVSGGTNARPRWRRRRRRRARGRVHRRCSGS